MSFLNQVLSSAEQADLNTLKKRLPTILSQISSSKQEVLKYIEDVYVKFSDWPKHNQKLCDVSSRLTTELNELQAKIQEVTLKEIERSNAEITGLSEELDCSKFELHIVSRLIEIHETLIQIRDFQKDKMVIKAGYEVLNLLDLIDSIPQDEVTDAVGILKDNALFEKTAVLNTLYEMFHSVIRLHSNVVHNVQTNTIKIKNKAEVTVLLEILELLNGFGKTLDHVAKFVLRVCGGVINNIATIKVEAEGSYHVLTIAIKKTIAKSQHREVFSKLTEIFAFLYSYFDYSVGNDLTTMRYIGNALGADFTKKLVEDCLDKTKVLSDNNVAYQQVVKDIIAFQAKLVEFNVLDSENHVLDYATKMDVLVIEQKCNEYLGDAITLMKKDLHDSIRVGELSGESNLLMPEEFPQSFISRSVIDILKLARKLLNEAQNSSDSCAARLICTVQSIFYQYGSIVYGHHEKLLQTIPQQVALFRNNCLYIAHILVQLNEEYNDKFSSVVVPTPPIFTDQGHQLRTIGGEIFLGYIDDQVRLMEMMLEKHLTPAFVAQELHPDLEKLIRQCLRQYELLRTVWIKILPHSVYNKSVGYVFNAFCKKLISAVISSHDIPSKNSEQLADTFKVVLTRGPKLFSSSEEIAVHVHEWPKLNDLVFILGANLTSISDIWAEGKGTLTLTFTAEEVRGLIKALFQNTDRRAAVLSKIH